MVKRILLIASVLGGLAAAGGVVAAPKPPRGAAATSEGARLYVATGCYQCHGYAGQGGMAGPRVAGKNYQLEAFRRQLRHPSDEMPPYTERVMSDADIAALQAYVATMK
jgi:mono/diheme cytochrome c family protein